MTTESLTYRELANRLGIKIESARKTVQRKRWSRSNGNDGQVRILVPIDALPMSHHSPSDTLADAPCSIRQRELEMEVEKLKALLHSTENDRDRWHALATRPWWRRLVG